MLPTKHQVQEYVKYDPNTGHFRYRLDSARSGKFGFKSGDLAGYKTNGYIIIFYRGHKMRAHRVAWLLMTGEWPTAQVDHINGVKFDNRFSNLRLASASENNMNRGPRSGRRFKGVWFDKQTSKWRVQIKSNGKVLSPGRFATEEEAAACYNYYSSYLHGEFSVPNKIATPCCQQVRGR